MSRFILSLSNTIYLLLFLVVHAKTSKLNVPRVLLPVFQDFPTNFTLEATDGGCYTWTTTRIDLVCLMPIDVDPDLECSTKVIVTTITKEQTRNIAVVFAEDYYTKQVIRCDVIVDVIDSLALFSRTRELFMEEAPEAFEVRAFDAQGNEFTTLENIEFDWKLVASGPNKDAVIVRFTTFKASPYEIPPSIREIEEQNKKGHIVLIEGVKTGTAKLLVRLPHEDYKNVETHEVQLSVVANLIIIPADVYIMAGDYISFHIIHMNNGKMEEVFLPHTQYYLDTENKGVASANRDNGEVSALKAGKTRVVLHDRNVDENDPGLKLPAAIINVVAPAYMTLTILPYKNWAVMLSEPHDIVAEVYSSNDHKIHLGPGVEIHTQVGDSFFVQQRSVNGSWLTGYGKSVGTAPVNAVLETIVHPKMGTFNVHPKMKASNEILIYPKIILNPTEIILPCDPNDKAKYDVDLTATGGDGKFLWTSSDHMIGMVTQSGHVRVHSCGSFDVSAVMQSNHHNRETAKFHILPPSRLEIIEYAMEAEVGSVIFLHVALFAEKPSKEGVVLSQVPFTNCQDIPFKVKTTDSNFYYNKTAIIPPVGISCATIGIIGRQLGTSRVTVIYGKEGQDSLEDTVTVSTFKPLQLLHPQQREIVLAVGTTMHLVFTGGPKSQYVHPPSESNRKITNSDLEIVKAYDVTDAYPGDDDRIVLRVLCSKLGESEIKLTVSSDPPMPNCINKESYGIVNVICGKPRIVTLQPEMKLADESSCPMDLGADKVVVQSNKPIELNVNVLDEAGRRFLNVSSLNFKWQISPSEMGYVHNKDSVFERIFTLYGGLIFGNESYQVVTVNGTGDSLEVTATVMSYKKDVLKKLSITPEWPEFMSDDEKGKELPDITRTLKLVLVDDTLVKTSELTLYNHPSNVRRIKVEQGSGYFQLVLSANEVAEVRYYEATREIEILPIQNGEVLISLVDLCLACKPAIITVSVVSISIIRVEMSDKVEINKCITCIVRFYDETDNLLGIPDPDMIDLKVNIDPPIVSIKKEDEEDNDDCLADGELRYIVHGDELGETKISFSVGSTDPEVSSAPFDLQVFPPLRLSPRNGTILIGATLQFNTKGGPHPDITIEYSTNVNNIAVINSTGLVKGLAIGHTKVTARAIGINPTNGQRVLYSEDTVDLHVIPLKGIKIASPLTRFKLGTTVPAWVTGLPEHVTPLILGSMEPQLAFHWSVDDPDVVQIKGIFEDTGVEYLPEDQISIRLVGLQAGYTRLNLEVTVRANIANINDKPNITYKHSLEFNVFEALMLISPTEGASRPILMAPHSTLQLQTNMDFCAVIKYSLPGSDDSTSTDVQKISSIQQPVVTVSRAGLLETHGTPGNAMVIVTATDEYGLKQTLNLIVEVKPIHYMMLNVQTVWRIHSDEPVHVLPVGVEFEVKTTYHDSTGEEFLSGVVDLKMRSSRFDLVRVKNEQENTSMIFSARKPGNTVMKVWAEKDHRTADYIKMHIGQTIVPFVDHFTTGDIICFWTPLRKVDLQRGSWTSSDPSLVYIDANNGVAKVIGIRGGTVSIIHTLHQAAPLHLQIVPAVKVHLYPSCGGYVTNSPVAKTAIPLIIKDEFTVDKNTNVYGAKDCNLELLQLAGTPPFTCFILFSNQSLQIDPNEVLSVQSDLDPVTCMHACTFRSGSVFNEKTSVLETNVTVWVTVDGTFVSSDPIELQFLPGVYVEEELILEEGSFKGVLVVTGLDKVLDQVMVTPLDKTLIEIGKRRKPRKNVLHVDVQLLDYHWKLDELDDPMSIILNSKLTEQNVKIHVRAHGIDKIDRGRCGSVQRSAIVAFIINYRHTLTIIISMIIIFFVTFYAYSKYIQPVINVNVNPNRSLLYSRNQLVNPNESPVFVAKDSSFSPELLCNQTRLACQQPNMNRSYEFGRNEPVYGDPSSFYCTSPELRRNRRFL